MSVVFSQLFEQQSEKHLGITKDMVRQAFAHSDKEQKLLAQGLEIRLYLKRFDSFHLLVQCVVQNDIMQVFLAFKIPLDIVDDTMEPLRVLERFATAFGFEIRVGIAPPTHFLYNTIVPMALMPHPQELIAVSNPERHPFIQSAFIRIEKKDNRFAAIVAMAYCIDKTRLPAMTSSNQMFKN